MKKLLFVLSAIFFSTQMFAVSLEDFSLSVEPLFGMKWGQIDEYVFLKESNFSDDKLSELNWEIKPELYGGIKVQGGWKGFFEESFFTAGIPMRSGLMFDSDWQNIQYTAANGGNTLQTNYSESENYLDYDFSFGFKGGYEFKVSEIVKIRPAIAFEYQNIKFTAKNGFGWYGNTVGTSGYHDYGPWYGYSDTENRTLFDFSGQIVIEYQRVSDFLWLGSDFSVDLPRCFIVTTGFFLAPYVYAVSFDAHNLRNYDFADRTAGYFAAFKWNLGAEYKITDRHSILLAANYFYMRVLRGDNYQKESQSSSYTHVSSCDGGAGAKWFDLTLSYRFKILKN